jgi:hypothetical protein
LCRSLASAKKYCGNNEPNPNHFNPQMARLIETRST